MRDWQDVEDMLVSTVAGTFALLTAGGVFILAAALAVLAAQALGPFAFLAIIGLGVFLKAAHYVGKGITE